MGGFFGVLGYTNRDEICLSGFIGNCCAVSGGVCWIFRAIRKECFRRHFTAITESRYNLFRNNHESVTQCELNNPHQGPFKSPPPAARVYRANRRTICGGAVRAATEVGSKSIAIGAQSTEYSEWLMAYGARNCTPLTKGFISVILA